MQDCIREHMCATARLRESMLRRAELAKGAYEGLGKIAKQAGCPKLLTLLESLRDSHVKTLEQLADAEYRSRLLYYALCLTESDPGLTPDDAIVQAETLVLEAAVGAI